jgi:hypothetical protein
VDARRAVAADVCKGWAGPRGFRGGVTAEGLLSPDDVPRLGHLAHAHNHWEHSTHPHEREAMALTLGSPTDGPSSPDAASPGASLLLRSHPVPPPRPTPPEPMDVLRAHGAFAALHNDDFRALLEREVVEPFHLAAGTALCREGVVSVASHVLILVRGAVAVSRGGVVLDDYCEPGRTLLADECRRAGVVAVVTLTCASDVVAWGVPRDTFNGLFYKKECERRALARRRRAADAPPAVM